MVLAVQCPSEKCKKYQLVEDSDRGKVVQCLLCKTAIKVGTAQRPATSHRPVTPPPRK